MAGLIFESKEECADSLGDDRVKIRDGLRIRKVGAIDLEIRLQTVPGPIPDRTACCCPNFTSQLLGLFLLSGASILLAFAVHSERWIVC